MASVWCLAAVLTASAQASDKRTTGRKQQVLWEKLDSEIREIARNLDGVIGVAIEDHSTGKTFFVNEDEVFPQASSIKIAVLAELYHQGQLSSEGTSGKAKLVDLYTVDKKDMVQDSDIIMGLTQQRNDG